MTQDEIIRMAREAAQLDGTNPPEKSVTLYAAKSYRFLEKFAALVAAAEKEECAKLMDDMAAQDKHSNYYKVAASAIRARGEA